MGLPVVTVATGGLPVVESTSGLGLPVTEAANGRGVAVTKVAALGLPVVFDASWSAAFTTPTLTTDSTGWTTTYSGRSVVSASLLSVSGTSVRLTLQSAPTVAGCTIDAMYLGHAAPSGDPYDFDGTQVQVKVGGSGTITIPVNSTVVTDPIAYTLNKTRNLVISYHSAITSAYAGNNSVTGCTLYYSAITGNDAAVTNVTGFTPVASQMQLVNKIEVSGALPAAGPANDFLGRAIGLDATHINAYTALINGLVADGIWSKFDVLHVYATQNAATALLNLVSINYLATVVGAVSFTADRGYTGPGGSAYLDTGFNPSTAPSPKSVQNSAHVSVWSLTNVASSAVQVMGAAIGGSIMGVHARYTDGNTYYYTNSSVNTGTATANSIGHFLANRPNSTTQEGYKNGASVISGSPASTAPINFNLYVCGNNQGGSGAGSTHQVAMSSIGSSLSSTEATNFYNRLRTYMTAVGVP